ncbi:MAG: SAM-dependent methyltransferase [Clostridia bacterium]|nr:SAM-dependent methyltransferase [Clostridia bacterium]
MSTLPSAFLLRMQDLLGSEYGDFLDALSAPSVHALRCVEKKMTSERLTALLPSLTPLSFLRGGFLVAEGERLGAHPLHHAGAYYMQDPSAMATVAALPFSIAGWRVLDLCAAPGGKSGQLSERLGSEGLLVSNEISSSRVRALLGNLERLGTENAVVTSLPPPAIAERFPEFFDLVVVDAPCSGEGMFRKYEGAAAEWSPAAVQAAAERGRHILDDAAATVAAGGYLLYSTCTFSEEENEENVTAFLAAHPEFSLVPVAEPVRAVTSDGIVRAGRPRDIALTRRFYPHKAAGEGQFLALLHREGGRRRELSAPTPQRPDKRREAEVRAALSELLGAPFEAPLLSAGEGWYTPPAALPLPPSAVLRAGVALGTLTGRTLLPHHHAYTALGDRFCRRVMLSAEDPRTAAYLHGEEIAAEGERGFAALLIEGAPTGGVKLSGGVAKNHYPKGLRSPNGLKPISPRR